MKHPVGVVKNPDRSYAEINLRIKGGKRVLWVAIATGVEKLQNSSNSINRLLSKFSD